MCRVLEDERRGVVQVSNLVEPIVASAEEALGYLEVGSLDRALLNSTAQQRDTDDLHYGQSPHARIMPTKGYYC